MTLRNQLILSFADHPWDVGINGRHQVLTRLARDNDVVFVDPPPYVRELWKERKEVPWIPQLRHVKGRLYNWQFPFWLGRTNRPAIEPWLLGHRVRLLKRLARQFPAVSPLLYVWHPFLLPLVRHFPKELVCYHVYDDYASFLQADVNLLRRLDRQLTARSQVVITVSDPLNQAHQGVGPEVVTVSNGVDDAAFSQPDLAEPPELAGIPRPRLILVSRLHGHLDYGLLQGIAEKSGFPLVVLGLIRPMPADREAQARAFLAHPRVHWFGEVPHEQVPPYLAHAGVGLMPFRQDGMSWAASPLKLYEYLAAGKPVVATDLPSVRPLGQLVRTAETLEEWVRQIREALVSDSPELVAARQTIARENSWDRKVEQISEVLARQREEQRARELLVGR